MRARQKGKSIAEVYLDTANLAVAAAQARLAMRLALTDYRVVLGGDLVGHGGWIMRHRIGGPSLPGTVTQVQEPDRPGGIGIAADFVFLLYELYLAASYIRPAILVEVLPILVEVFLQRLVRRLWCLMELLW